MANVSQDFRGPADEEGKGDTDTFLKRAVRRFSRADSAESENRQMALEDLEFKSGDQWPEEIKASRMMEKRPCLTINKMKTFVHQITNDQRQNRPAINVSPVGDKGDRETAKMLKGLIRQIERQSDADVAYDTAFDSAVSCGWGYWRVETDYLDDNSFDQVLKVSRIRNPFRVYIDPDHQEPDGSDAKWLFITDLVTREEFKAQFPKADPCAWNEGAIGDEFEDTWATETHVRIAEYFYYESESRTLLALANGQTGFKEDLDQITSAYIKADPSLVLNERKVEVAQLYWCKITAKEVLEKTKWLGKWIPVVKVIGDESDVAGKVSYAGLVRDAKDPQRMYNFWCTSETELIALAPKAPWVMEEGQIEGHEVRWASANVKSYPYLLYKGVNIGGKPAPQPQRQQFAGPPAGVVQAKIGASQDMQAVTGIRFDATHQERSYDESGKALRELKAIGDLGNFHYVDNLSRSLRHTGRIFIDLIPKIYDTRRVETIIREDGEDELATLDPGLQQPFQKSKDQQGKVQRLYNPRLGTYDVTVTIGPSFATKRSEASESMINFLKVMQPQQAAMVTDLIAKNQDWPGADEFATRLEIMLPPQLQQGKMDEIPPEARGMVSALQQQLQQLKQERDQAVALLGDKDKDRQIEQDKINKDFEAKMAKIAADMEQAKMDLLVARNAPQEDTGAAHAKIAADSEAAHAKIAADFEAKILKIVADTETARMKHEMEMKFADIEAKQAKTDEKQEPKPAAMPKMPDIHVHLPSEKRKISKSKDGSYVSEPA